MIKACLAIDKNERLLRLAETPPGKILILALFACFMHGIQLFPLEWEQVIVVTLTLVAFFPKHRYLWLFIGMMSLMLEGYLVKSTPDWYLFRYNYLYLDFENGPAPLVPSNLVKYYDLLIMLVLSETLIYFTHHRYRLAQYPITLAYSFVIVLILLAESIDLSKEYFLYVWSFITVYNHYFWFFGYTLLESRVSVRRYFLLDYARYLPVWGFTALPYGKGSIYLRQVEVHTRREMARLSLNALKLSFWAFLLHWVLQGFYVVQDYFHIPTLASALQDYAGGLIYPVWKSWVVLWTRFFRMMLELTVTGHLAVAACRLCGFRILRNTYKPLQSATIADFWNRYNFYFKELLAEFFFYPAYFRFFKTRPRLRMFFATLAAATFGNVLFHFLLLGPALMAKGLVEVLRGYLPFMFYAVLLGVSIGISQLRQLSRQRAPGRGERWLAPVFVLFYFAILSLFNRGYQSESILVNFNYFLGLFGLAG